MTVRRGHITFKRDGYVGSPSVGMVLIVVPLIRKPPECLAAADTSAKVPL